MSVDIDYICDLRSRMTKLGVCQIQLVSELIKTGRYSEDNRASLNTQVNFALTGRRSSKRYLELLSEVDEVLSGMEDKESV